MIVLNAGNDNKYTAAEMRKILQAFLDKCPDRYEV